MLLFLFPSRAFKTWQCKTWRTLKTTTIKCKDGLQPAFYAGGAQELPRGRGSGLESKGWEETYKEEEGNGERASVEHGDRGELLRREYNEDGEEIKRQGRNGDRNGIKQKNGKLMEEGSELKEEKKELKRKRYVIYDMGCALE